ncbi:MAG: flippase-like domain-containing protein [Acidobacteriota bacterium]|nr:flippase-like domain-containing protein [Acidobacteriota bacterium]
MDTVEASRKPRKTPKWLLPVVGYSLSALSLVWVFSKFPFAQLGEHLRTMDWTWVAVAVLCELGVYFVDAWRWMVLLRPVGAPSFGVCLQSVFVGLFANDLLPARAGEIIRCFLLSFKSEVPLSLALTSDFIERMMDGLWVVIIYVLITWQVATHTLVNRVMWGFSLGVVVIWLIILWMLFHRQHAHHFINNTGWAARFVHFLEEIHRLGHWPELNKAMAISGLYWLGQLLAVWAIARADGFYFSYSDMGFLLVVRTIFTLIPNAPASMGAYQASAVYALERLLTEPNSAKILAEIMFGFLTLPLVLGGAVAIAVAGFNLGDLRRHAHHAHSLRKSKPGPTTT